MIDVFRIGVNIAVATSGQGAIGVLLGDLAGLHKLSHAVNQNFAAMKGLAIGALGVMAGGAALRGIWDLLDASKELNTQLERAKLTGASAADIALMRQTAINTSISVPTSTPSSNLKMETELKGQLNSAKEAAELLPYFQKMAYVLHIFTGKDEEGAAQIALKTADNRGSIFSRGANGEEAIDPAKLRQETEALTKGIIASGGLLGANDYFNFAKQSGLAGKQMDIATFYGMATEAMIAMGSSRAGTATGSLYQQIIGGTMTERVAEEMKKHGLLTSYRVGRGGTILPNSAGVVRKDEFQTNEFAWINDVVVPKLQKEGMNPRQIIEEIAHLFGRQTTQRLVGESIMNKTQMARTFKLFQQAMGAEEGYDELQNNSLQTNMDSLAAAWKGFIQVLGDAGVPAAIVIFKNLTDAIHVLTDLAEAHQTISSWLIGIAAGFSALVLVGGGYLVISTALGPIAAGLTLLAGATAAFAPGAAAALGLAALVTTIGGLAAAAGLIQQGTEGIATGSNSLDRWIDKHILPNLPRLPDWAYPGGHGPRSEAPAMPDGTRGRVQLESYHAGDRPIILMLDGRAIGRSVSAAQARQMSLPPGSTSFDPRMTLLTPATAVQL